MLSKSTFSFYLNTLCFLKSLVLFELGPGGEQFQHQNQRDAPRDLQQKIHVPKITRQPTYPLSFCCLQTLSSPKIKSTARSAST
jgi:hypothetical protein